MTTSDSFSFSDGANPPASASESTSVNSQNDVSTATDPSVNLPRQSVNLDTASSGKGALAINRDAVRAYLTEVYAGVPGLMQIWTTPAKGSGAFFPTTDEGIDQAVTFVEAQWKMSGQQGIYSRITTLKEKPTEKGSRGSVAQSASFIGLWTDLDFGNVGHKGGNLPPGPMEAHEIYQSSGLPEASIVVNSGGGLYHLVLLDEPLDITDTELRLRVGQLARRWQYQVKIAAQKMGYDYGTGVSDLARVLRVPGTINAKEWANQRLAVHRSTGLRYSLEELEAACPAPPKPTRPTGVGGLATAAAADATSRMNQLADEMRATTWERNNALNRLTYMCFQYAGAGQLDPQAVEDAFTRAGLDSGLDAAEVRHTVSSARKGMTEPYTWTVRLPAVQAREQVDMWAGQTDGNGHVITRPTAPQHPAPKQTPEPAPEAPEAEPAQEFEDRDAFAERMGRITDPSVKKNEARKRVKAFAQLKSTEEERQVERDFLKATCKLTAGDFKSLYASAARTAAQTQPDGSDTRPVFVMGDEHREYLNLVELIENGAFPELYVRDGKLVHVQPVSGVRSAKGAISTSTYQAKDITPATMRRLVATYTLPYRQTEKGADSPLPARALCESVLDNPEWDGVDTLQGLTDAPFVRADGTICQDHGYDQPTGMWLALPPGFKAVPENPTPEDVAGALDLLMNKVLRDFPFASTADRANTIGMLITPMIRNITDCAVPLHVISAHTPGTGKTLIAKIASAVHGGSAYQFPRNSDEELRKQVTSILMDQASPVVNFDNLATGSTIESPALAALITSDVWKDRVLGGNTTVALPNDKLWIATGNNLKVNSDFSQRTVLLHLDAGTERPDLRPAEEFELGDLEEWLLQPQNRAALVRALLILIRDWAAAGMPKSDHAMRSFTPWARAIGGLLAHHGITHFLGNTETVAEADEEKQQDALFLQKWTELITDEWISASDLITKHQLMDQARYSNYGGMAMDPWQGSFPLRSNGRPFSAIGLGKWLGARKDTPTHGFVLRRRVDPDLNRAEWRVEQVIQDKPEVATQTAAFEPDRK